MELRVRSGGSWRLGWGRGAGTAMRVQGDAGWEGAWDTGPEGDRHAYHWFCDGPAAESPPARLHPEAHAAEPDPGTLPPALHLCGG